MKLNNIHLNTTEVKEDSREMKNYFELNGNKNTTYQNLWDIAKAIHSGKFIALKAHIRKEENAKINHLNMTVTCQAPLSMEFSRLEYWSR